MSDPLAFLERRREARERRRMDGDGRTMQLSTPHGTAQLVERGPDWWEVRLSQRFVGLVVKWHNHPSAPWEALLPIGSARAGITITPPRYETMELAVAALCASYSKHWRTWPVGGFEA